MKLYGYFLAKKYEDDILPAIIYEENQELYSQCIRNGKIVDFKNLEEYDNSDEIKENIITLKMNVHKKINDNSLHIILHDQVIIKHSITEAINYIIENNLMYKTTGIEVFVERYITSQIIKLLDENNLLQNTKYRIEKNSQKYLFLDVNNQNEIDKIVNEVRNKILTK